MEFKKGDIVTVRKDILKYCVNASNEYFVDFITNHLNKDIGKYLKIQDIIEHNRETNNLTIEEDLYGLANSYNPPFYKYSYNLKINGYELYPTYVINVKKVRKEKLKRIFKK